MELWDARFERVRLSLLLLGLLLCCRSLEDVHSNVARLRCLLFSSGGGRLRLGSLRWVFVDLSTRRASVVGLVFVNNLTRLRCWWLKPRRREIGDYWRHSVSWCWCVV